jgi:hypothetical protein
MSDDEDDEPINVKYKEGFLQRVYNKTFGWLFGAISSVIVNGIFAGIPTVFSGIVWVIRIIFMALYYILFKIVPFLVQYVGIPMFILGAIMGIMFLGGHMLFVVLFIVGLYYYIRGLLNIKLVSKGPTISNNTTKGPSPNNNEMKFK